MRQVPQPLLISAGLAAALLLGSVLLAPPLARMGDVSANATPADAAPRVAFDTRVTHDYASDGERIVTVALPRSALPAEIVLDFEGAAAGGDARIRVFDPDGRLVVETTTADTAMQVDLQDQPRASAPSVLAEGEWRVEFSGATAGLGHARFRTL